MVGTDLSRPVVGTDLSRPVVGTDLSRPVVGTDLSRPGHEQTHHLIRFNRDLLNLIACDCYTCAAFSGTACKHFWCDAVHVFDETDTLKRPDDVAGQVELPPVQAVKGRAWEGVMIVMPTLTKTEQANYPFVTALIARLELTFAEGMTDRIDTPCHMMCQEDTYKSAPEQASPATEQEWNE